MGISAKLGIVAILIWDVLCIVFGAMKHANEFIMLHMPFAVLSGLPKQLLLNSFMKHIDHLFLLLSLLRFWVYNWFGSLQSIICCFVVLIHTFFIILNLCIRSCSRQRNARWFHTDRLASPMHGWTNTGFVHDLSINGL